MVRIKLTSHCLLAVLCLLCAGLIPTAGAQEKSVNPGINDTFRDPDVKEFTERFEVESREVFARRKEIIEACAIKPGETIADIGAGTGLFTRLFSQAVGKEGRVIAVDISQKFLDSIRERSRQAGQQNVDTLLASADSTNLPANSVDLAFICDTYHHFEFPQKTLASIHRALKTGGRIILIDFRRIEGESSDWTLRHVRAGQEVFESEIEQAGFRKIRQEPELLKENYFVVFEKQPSDAAGRDDSSAKEPGAGGPGPGRGPGAGRGRGAGRGPGAGRGLGAALGARPSAALGPGVGDGIGVAVLPDQRVFHYLLEHHAEIRRSVQIIPGGVQTVTESDNPEIVAKIQEHVDRMHWRIENGRGIRYWDDLFTALFRNYASIDMEVENTDHGVRVKETSEDPMVVGLIRAHARVVSLFVEHGFEEAHRNHAVPPAEKPAANLMFPIIERFGGVVPRPTAAEQPKSGAKVVFDATSDAPPEQINKGLERVARLLNLYGSSGLKASDVTIAIVLHGEATKSVLNDAAYQSKFGVETNPNLPLIEKLIKAGVEVFVCGQALQYKGFADNQVADQVTIAAAALTVVINKQQQGYAYIPVN